MGSNEHGAQAQQAEKFYDEVADYAKSKSIQINIITMQGTDCKLGLLGRVADKTNGSLNIVNPVNLSEEFKTILENRIVATEVKATLIVNHTYLYIRTKELEAEEGRAYEAGNKDAEQDRLDTLKTSKNTRDIGNANIDTEITFEYGIRRLKKQEKGATAAAASTSKEPELKEMPFQLQIEYTHQGAKLVRVYTKKQAFTKSREEALDNLFTSDIIFSNAMHNISEQVMTKNAGYADMRCIAVTKMAYNRNMLMPTMMMQQREQLNNLQLRSSGHMDVNEFNDEEAHVFYSAKKANRKHFSKK